jgi:ABC-type amino acid transport substrate-binding protein
MLEKRTSRRWFIATAVGGATTVLAACQSALAPSASAPAPAATAAPVAPAAPAAASSGTFTPAIDRITQSKKLRVGWAVWSPYFVKDPSGSVKGVLPGIIDSLAKELNADVQWVEDSWATVVAGFAADKFDMSLGLDPTLTRALVAGFTNAYGGESNNLIIRKADAAKDKTWQDLNQPGLKIGVTLGADFLVNKAFTKAEIVRLKTFPESVLALQAGQLNAAGSGLGAVRRAAKEDANLEVMAGPYGLTQSTMALRREDQISTNWLNLFLAEQERSGRLDALYNEAGLERRQTF